MRIHPAALLFCVFSLIAGFITIAATPPLRGPDENAHFLRAYGLAQGDIIPQGRDEQGRKGLWLPYELHAQFDHFEAARASATAIGFQYRQVFAAYREAFTDATPPSGILEPVFTLYGGAEGYSPAAYIPYVAVAAIAPVAQLDFLNTLYLMRIVGLVVSTALVAYAIALTPVLPWGFFAIAMLPSALFGRAVVNADGPMLGATFLVIALSLRAAMLHERNTAARGVWMTLCALTKPSQVAFALVEGMAPGRWRWPTLARIAAVTLPGVVLAAVWAWLIDADMAAWRTYQVTGTPPEQFQLGWKLQYLLSHPLQFPAAVLGSMDFARDFWRQLVGVLGWLDTPLHPLAYPTISGLLIVAGLGQLDASPDIRRRIVVSAALTTAAYGALVFFLFWVTSTPAAETRVLGLQGRYFLVVLPLVFLVIAAALPFRPPVRLQAFAAVLLAIVSSFLTIEAILRTAWS